jgi:chromosome segregation ATPase
MVGAALLLLTLSGSTLAQTTAPTTKAESVVVPITAAATKFQHAIGDGLGQRLEELRAAIKEASARVHAALDTAQKDGSEDANARYEQVVSAELERVQQALQAVGAEKTGVLTAQRELTGQLDRLRDTLQQRQATLARQVKERGTAVDQLTARLAALADKNRSNLDSGTALAADDDLQVRALAQEIALAQQQHALTVRAGEDADARLAKLRTFDGQLNDAGGEYNLLFDRANGQVRLIGQLAEMRREGVEVGAVITQLNKVGAQLAAVTTTLDDASATIDDLIAAPLLSDQTAVGVPTATAAAPRQSGLEILKKFLEGRKSGGDR